MRRGPWSRRPSPVRRCLSSRPREQVNGRQVEREIACTARPCPTTTNRRGAFSRSKVLRPTEKQGLTLYGGVRLQPRPEWLEPEHAPHLVQPLDQRIDVRARGVRGEARARRGGDAEVAHQRLGAVVAGPHTDVSAI